MRETWNSMQQAAIILCLASIIPALAEGQDRDQRIADLERQLTEAKGSVAALQKAIESLSKEVQALRQPELKLDVATTAATAAPPTPSSSKEADESQPGATHEFAARIIDPDIGSNEHDHPLEA